MGRLIDADELKAVYIPSGIEGFEEMMIPMEVVLQNIDDMPTVDAVPVVRCKDCKWWRDTDHTCKEHSLVSPMRADEFCSRGEREDGNDD